MNNATRRGFAPSAGYEYIGRTCGCEATSAPRPVAATTATATAYRVASITKTFTATEIMQLRDTGKLGLDGPVVDRLD